jgi:hypothetical protein
MALERNVKATALYDSLRQAGFSSKEAQSYRYYSTEKLKSKLSEKALSFKAENRKVSSTLVYRLLRLAGFKSEDASRYRTASRANIAAAIQSGELPEKRAVKALKKALITVTSDIRFTKAYTYTVRFQTVTAFGKIEKHVYRMGYDKLLTRSQARKRFIKYHLERFEEDYHHREVITDSITIDDEVVEKTPEQLAEIAETAPMRPKIKSRRD